MKVERWHAWATSVAFGLPSAVVLMVIAQGGNERPAWAGYLGASIGFAYVAVVWALHFTQTSVGLGGRFRYTS